MKKLYTPKSGTVGYILGHALIGGKQFRMVDAENSEIVQKAGFRIIDMLTLTGNPLKTESEWILVIAEKNM